MYVIAIDQGDYYQGRGGYDWGRSDWTEATTFDAPEDAEAEIGRCGLASFGAAVQSLADLDGDLDGDLDQD